MDNPQQEHTTTAAELAALKREVSRGLGEYAEALVAVDSARVDLFGLLDRLVATEFARELRRGDG